MPLTFKEQLIITLIDKAAIGLLVLIAGYSLNKLLEKFKKEESFRK